MPQTRGGSGLIGFGRVQLTHSSSLPRHSPSPRQDRVRVPRAIDGLVTPKLLVMEFLDGQSLNDVKKHAGDVPEWKRRAFGQQLLGLMSSSWGRMIFGAGLFHGDAHPGNLLINMRSRRLLGRLLPPRLELGIIDLGQSKQLTRDAQHKLARVVLALSDPSPSALTIASALRATGLQFERMGAGETEFLARAARLVFSTEAVDGRAFNPFGADSILAENAVRDIPPDLVFVIRVVQMQRGLAAALGCDDFSLAAAWRAAAQELVDRRNVYKSPTARRR